jgi:hypothetical protein
VSICLFCLAKELGDKPYIVRHQDDDHAAECAERTDHEIAAAKETRLEEVMALFQPTTGATPNEEDAN